MRAGFILIFFLVIPSIMGVASSWILESVSKIERDMPINITFHKSYEYSQEIAGSQGWAVGVSESDIIAGNLTDHGWVMRRGQLLAEQANFSGFTVARWSKDENNLFVVVASYSDNDTFRTFYFKLWRVNVSYFWVSGINVSVNYEEIASYNISLNNTNTPFISDMDAVILDNGTMLLAFTVTMMDWFYKIKYSYMYVLKYANVSESNQQLVQIDYIDHLGNPPNVYLYFSIGLELSADGNETALNMALGYYYTSDDGSIYVLYGVLLVWYGEASRKYEFAFLWTSKIMELSNLVLYDNISVVAMSVYMAQYDLDATLIMAWNITANSSEEDAIGFGALNIASDYFDLFGGNPEFRHIGLGVYNNSTALWFVVVWEAHTDSDQYILYGTATYYYAYDNSSSKYGIHIEIGELGIITQSFRALQFIYADADIFDRRGTFLFVDYDILTASYVPNHILYILNDTGNIIWFGPFSMDVTTKKLPRYDLEMFNSRNIFGVAQINSENISMVYPLVVFRDLDRDYLGDWEEINVYQTDPANPDSDGDGLNDGTEIHKYHTDPLSIDTDGDGLDDKFELEVRPTTIYEEYGNITNLYPTDPLIVDTDGDNITDYLEVTGNYTTVDGHAGYMTDPTRKDTDGDGLSDYEETFLGFEYWVNETSNRFVVHSDPTLKDSDFDNITDRREMFLELNPLSNDTDNDGLLDLEERQIYRTNPHVFDTDKDLLGDYEEISVGTNPLKNDTDGDNLSDGEEVQVYMTSPLQKDSDGDGLEDGQEVLVYFTDPLINDSDGDGLSDSLEIFEYNTDPLSNDSDSDGLSDYQEVKGVYIDGLNKTVRLNPLINDTDGDGLSDYQEYQGFMIGSERVNTDPTLWDTDGDGLSDSYELTFSNTNPILWDTDGDGLGDGSEVLEYKTDPLSLDTDSDNLTDYEEIFGVNITGIGVLSLDPLLGDSDEDNVSDYYEAKIYNTNPLKNDTDGDGLSDYFEIYLSWNVTLIINGSTTYSVHSNPLNYDSDGDGLSDYEEYLVRSDPNIPDTDSDNLTDGEEYYIGTSPVSRDSDGDGLSDYEEYTGVYVEGIGNVTLSPISNDTDGDNLDDFSEVRLYLTDPTSSDTDGDGIGDYQEVLNYKTDPRSPDTDGDGLEDLEELELYRTNPLLNDSDGDGLSDGEEIFGIQVEGLGFRKTDPLINDTDGDGLSDYEEVKVYLTDPTKLDTDGDGLSDSIEISAYSTDPRQPDSDGDGLSDGEEIAIHSDSLLNDTDGDGLTDYEEYVKFGTYPTKSDSDGDGLNDGEEIELSTNPLVRDSDGDGLSDYDEVERYGTDPLVRDSDGDGLSDWTEIKVGSDPLKVDTDGDGLSDYREVEVLGTDPTSKDTDGDLIPDPVDLVFPLIPDWFLVIAVTGTALLYYAYSYGLFRNWKSHIIAAGLSDLGGILMFAIPDEFKDKYNASLISSGLLGIQTLTGEIVGKQTERLILSGEIPIFIRRGSYTIFWVFLKKTYPRIIKALESIHKELEEEFEPVLSSWSGIEEEVEEVRYWLASKLEIKGLPEKTVSVEEEFEKVFEE